MLKGAGPWPFAVELSGARSFLWRSKNVLFAVRDEADILRQALDRVTRAASRRKIVGQDNERGRKKVLGLRIVRWHAMMSQSATMQIPVPGTRESRKGGCRPEEGADCGRVGDEEAWY